MSRKIIGVTVGTQLPKPNFKQDDPTKGDYIKNRPDFDGLQSRVDSVSALVGDTKVSEQISNAIVTKVDKVDGQRLITTDEADKLKALVIGENGQVGISGTVNADNVQGLADKLALKVDKVDGKGLSTNDYTTAEKSKLAAIEAGANKTIVDSALSDTSTNPVQNKVVNEAIDDLYYLVGDGTVADQISDALNSYNADMNAAQGEAGHIVHRTHYSEYVATLLDNVVMNNNITSSKRGEFCYNDIKDYDELTVVFDGVVYECPITVRTSITDAGDESYFYAGNWSDSDPRYPFYILGYLSQDTVLFGVGEGEHTVSVKLSEVTKKLDAKYLPEEVFAASDWNAKEGEAGHILNRTHWKDAEEKVLAENATVNYTSGYSNMVNWLSYEIIKDHKTATIIYDGIRYKCDITFDGVTDKYFTLGNWDGNTLEYPFGFFGYKGTNAFFKGEEGNHTITFVADAAVKKLDEEYLPDNLVALPDWNAEEGKPGYIANRTHWKVEKVILPLDTYKLDEDAFYYTWVQEPIEAGKTYKVSFNGEVFERKAEYDSGFECNRIGNEALLGGEENEHNDPFCIFIWDYGELWLFMDVQYENASVSIGVEENTVQKIPVEYLPDDIGGASSWNDLTDKPFHIETAMIYPTFDGNLDGREYAEIPGTGYTVKVSDEYVSVEDMIGAVLTANNAGRDFTIELTAENVVDATYVLGVPGTVVISEGDMWAASFPTETTGMGVTLSAGTWFGYAPENQFYVKSISCLTPIEGESVEKINPSCMPEGYPYTESVDATILEETSLTANENGELIFESVLPLGYQYAITYNGTEYICDAVDGAILGEPGIVVLGNYKLAMATGDTGEPFIIMSVPDYGMSAALDINGNTTCTISVRQFGEIVHKLDMKYLPDGYPYSETVTIDPTFNGDITGLETVLVQEGTYAVKVSPEYVECTAMIGCTAVVNMGGTEQEMPLTAENIFDAMLVLGVSGAIIIIDGDPVVISLPTDSNIMGMTFSAGTWFMCVVDQFHVKSLSCLASGEQEIVHKLDNKFIDAEWMATTETKENIIEISPTFSIASYDSVDYVSKFWEAGKFTSKFGTLRIVMDGVPYDTTYMLNDERVEGQMYEPMLIAGNLSIIGAEGAADTGEPFALTCFLIVESDTFVFSDGNSHTISIGLPELCEEVKKIPQKYLPDSVPYAEITTTPIVFDGNMAGRESVPFGDPLDGFHLVKVSTEYIPAANMIGATLIAYTTNGKMTFQLSEENVINGSEVYGIEGSAIRIEKSDLVFSIPAETTMDGITLTAGTWFACVENNRLYVESLSCLVSEQEVVHKLDSKFINAEWMAATKDEFIEICPDTEVTNLEYTNLGICDFWKSGGFSEKNGTLRVKIDGVPYDVGYILDDVRLSNHQYEPYLYVGNWSISNSDMPNTGDPFFIVSSLSEIYMDRDGIAFLDGGTHTVSISLLKQTPDKLPMKYLPEGYPYIDTSMVNVTFDGNMAEHETIEFVEGLYFVKVSPQYVPITSVVGSTAVCKYKEEEQTIIITEEDVVDASEAYGADSWSITKTLVSGSSSTTMPLALGLSVGGTYNGITLSAGVWFVYRNNGYAYTKSLSCLNGEQEVIHKLDNKFIDAEWMASGEEIIKKSNVVMPKIEVEIAATTASYPDNSIWNLPIQELSEKEYLVEYDGISYILPCSSSMVNNGDEEKQYYYLGNKNFVDDAFESTGELFCIYKGEYSYRLFGEVGYHTVAIYEFTRESNKLPEKYLPESVATKEYVDNAIAGGATGGAQIQIITWEADD